MSTDISVIIPVYNVEKYLSNCLESVLAQTMDNFEVILVNDGSIDKSAYICEKFAERDKRLKVFHKKNSGPASARNFGLQKAIGKYIMFIDADDYINHDTFKVVFNVAEKSSLDLVVYSIYEKNVNDLKRREINECTFEDQKSKKEFLKQVWIDSGMLASPVNKLYRTEVIKRNNILFNEDFFIAEDYLFNLKLIDVAKKGVSINTPLYYYLRHEESVSTKVYYNKYDIGLAIYKESLKLFTKYNIKEKPYLDKIHEEFATSMIRAMFETTRQGYNKSLFIKLSDIKKCMSVKEIRALFSNSMDFSVFNRFVIFCLKYKQSFIYYLAFKLRNITRGI